MMRNKIGKQVLAVVLTAALCIPSFSVMAEEGEQVQAEESQVASQAEETSGAKNAMSSEAYKDFGLDVSKTPEEFELSDTSNPLEDYQTQILSELYIGQMNRGDDYKGSFKVMENVTEASADSLSITKMDDNLVGNETKFPYPENKDTKEVQTHNACGIDYDGDGLDEIVDMTLYVDREKDPKISCMDISLYDREEDGNWQLKNTMTKVLTNSKSDDETFVWSIEADSAKALTAITAGDFDQDGKEECAVYMPSYGIEDPCVLILSADGGILTQTQKIKLKDLSNNAFNISYKGWMLPAVSLSTTQISGQDDLVINASLPMEDDDNYKNADQNSVTAIYRYDSENQSMSSVFKPVLEDESGYRMRFASSTDADLNGNGVKELLIGGFQNWDYSENDHLGKISKSKNTIMMVCWDPKQNQYVSPWSEAKIVESMNTEDIRVDKTLMEPAAMASGALSRGSKVTQVFLEGILFRYTNAAATAETEKDYYASGSFVKSYKMSLEGSHDAFISTATAANFASNEIGQDQMVIITGDHYSMNKDKIYYDIGWIWESNGVPHGEITNNDYFYRENEDDDGTFLSLCALDVDTDTMHVEYTGKDFGWSEPVLYSILQSTPYWRELQYPEELFGTGGSSMEISTGHENGCEGELGIGLGYHIRASAKMGAGLFGTDIKGGMGAEFSFMASYLGSYGKKYESENSFEIHVAPGEDYAVVLAIPMVVYHYDVLIPGHYATQDDVDSYNKLETDTPCPYVAGEWIKESIEKTDVSIQLDQAFSYMPIEKYNELADTYSSEGITKISDTNLAHKEIGDPSTYPSSEAEIKAPGDVNNLNIITPAASITEAEGEIEIAHKKTMTTEKSNGFELEYENSLFSSIGAEVSLGIQAEAEMESGFVFAPSAGCKWMESSGKGIQLSGTVAGLPKGSQDYGFSTNLVCYNASNIGVGQTTDENLENNGPYVLGYMVTGLDEGYVPSSIPENLRVFSTTEHEVALKWNIPTIAGRVPESYKLYMKDNQGNGHVLQDESGNDVIIPGNQTYYVITGLNPNTTYEFAIQSFGDKMATINPSVVSRYVGATTKAESGNPYFIKQPENVCLTWKEEAQEPQTATFTAEAVSDESNSKPVAYQWQKYENSSVTGIGDFVDLSDVDGSVSGSQSTDLTITMNESNRENQPTCYRAVAIVDGQYSTYSRTATLFLSDEEGNYIYHNLDMNLSIAGDHIYQLGSEYYTLKNQIFTIKASMENSEGEDYLPVGGSVDFYVAGSNGEWTSLGTGTIGEDGTAAITVENSFHKDTSDTYEIYAFYEGGTSGTDTKNYYLPTRSDALRLNVGKLDETEDYYRIYYHGNGGSVPLSNPRVMTPESQPVELATPVKYGSIFNSWYSDESLDETSTVTIISPALFSEEQSRMDVYAGWNLVEFPITYELDGGTNHKENPSVYTVETGKITLKDPQKDGYNFKGWYSDPAYTDACNMIESNSVGEKTFYAKWEEKKTPDPFDKDDEVYLISNLEELREAALLVHEYYDTYGNAKFRLTANIDGNASEWNLPIGTSEHPFKGEFEGDNYRIYNLKLTGKRDYQGIFGVIESEGRVSNLNTLGLRADENATVIGGIAGSNYGTINKCSSGLYVPPAYWITDKIGYLEDLNSQYTAKETAGGIAGVNEGNIYNCNSTATIHGGSYGGGIAGVNAGNISNGYNMGAVSVDTGNSGGIAGYNQDDASIFNAYNSGMVTGGYSSAIVGSSDNTNITKCYYHNSSQSACSNQELGDAVYRSSDEMRTQEFADILNQNIGGMDGLNTWIQTKNRNGSYPKIQENNLTEETLTESQYQLTIIGKNIHQNAKLVMSDVEQNTSEHQKLYAAADGKQIQWMKNVNLVLQNGNEGLKLDAANLAPFDGTLKIQIKTKKPDDMVLYHVTEEGEVEELKNESKDGAYFETTVDSLSPFAFVNTKVQATADNKSSASTSKPKGVLTGDTNMVLFWLIITSIALLAVALTFIRRCRK